MRMYRNFLGDLVDRMRGYISKTFIHIYRQHPSLLSQVYRHSVYIGVIQAFILIIYGYSEKTLCDGAY